MPVTTTSLRPVGVFDSSADVPGSASEACAKAGAPIAVTHAPAALSARSAWRDLEAD
jgi:hypothetical protein